MRRWEEGRVAARRGDLRPAERIPCVQRAQCQLCRLVLRTPRGIAADARSNGGEAERIIGGPPHRWVHVRGPRLGASRVLSSLDGSGVLGEPLRVLCVLTPNNKPRSTNRDQSIFIKKCKCESSTHSCPTATTEPAKHDEGSIGGDDGSTVDGIQARRADRGCADGAPPSPPFLFPSELSILLSKAFFCLARSL